MSVTRTMVCRYFMSGSQRAQWTGWQREGSRKAAGLAIATNAEGSGARVGALQGTSGISRDVLSEMDVALDVPAT